jgi:hypothetical protein
MDGFGLLIGHLLGDYIFQNDWMAANKTNLHPGPCPASPFSIPGILGARVVQQIIRDMGASVGLLPDDVGEAGLRRLAVWEDARQRWWLGHLACTIHCLIYAISVWLCSWWWMPWWGVLACFVVHWPIDRWRLARVWMMHVSGQKAFASGALAPWSVIVVDNTFHLLTLFVIAQATRF